MGNDETNLTSKRPRITSVIIHDACYDFTGRWSAQRVSNRYKDLTGRGRIKERDEKKTGSEGAKRVFYK